MHNDMFQPTKINREEAEEVVKQVCAIVTISDYIGQVIRDLYPEAEGKLRTIYSGVDSDRFYQGIIRIWHRFVRNYVRRMGSIQNSHFICWAFVAK